MGVNQNRKKNKEEGEGGYLLKIPKTPQECHTRKKQTILLGSACSTMVREKKLGWDGTWETVQDNSRRM